MKISLFSNSSQTIGPKGPVLLQYWRTTSTFREEPKFFHAYLMGNTDKEAKQRNRYVGGDLQMNIIVELQEMLHYNHAYVSIFK